MKLLTELILFIFATLTVPIFGNSDCLVEFFLGEKFTPTSDYNVDALWNKKVVSQVQVTPYKNFEQNEIGEFGFETANGQTWGIGVNGEEGPQIDGEEAIVIDFSDARIFEVTVGIRAYIDPESGGTDAPEKDITEIAIWRAMSIGLLVADGVVDVNSANQNPDGSMEFTIKAIEFEVNIDPSHPGSFLGLDKIEFLTSNKGNGYYLEYIEGKYLEYCHFIGGRGDPHFATWSNEHYDYHGVCDLVLLHNPEFENGVSMDIHLRTKQTRAWSYIANVAISIGGEILEVMGGKDTNRYWINKLEGKPLDPKGDSFLIAGYTVRFTQSNGKAKEFAIELDNNQIILIKIWNAMVSVNIIRPDVENFGSSVGLIGRYKDGNRISRDQRTTIDDSNAFGQEWQVLSTEQMLFHEIDGPQFPSKCKVPSITQMRRRLGETLVTRKNAEYACNLVTVENFELCIFDVMATNDIDSAGAY